MAANTKWDTSELTNLVRNLANEKEIIEDNRKFLESINSEVEKAWQGYTGRAFDERMDIDTENLGIVISCMDKLIGSLNDVIKNCYEACEDDIRAQISSLRSKV